MLTETQLLVGSSVLMGMAYGAALMLLVVDSKYTSIPDILASSHDTAKWLGGFVGVTALWAIYVVTDPAIVFPYWGLPFAWALLLLAIVRGGLSLTGEDDDDDAEGTDEEQVEIIKEDEADENADDAAEGDDE